MKKALFLLFLISLPMQAFANISFTDELPFDIEKSIRIAIEENSRGRDDIDFNISSYRYATEEGRIDISFDLSFLDKKLYIDIQTREKTMDKDIRKAISNALFYEKSLYLDSDEILDYIYDKSFSFLPDKHYRKGTTFTLKDSNNKTQGVFEVKQNYNEATLLQPLYIANATPGLRLKESSSWRYSITAGSNMYIDNFSMSVSLGNTSIVYPIVPIVSLSYEQSARTSFISFGIGIESFFDLNDFLKSSFTLIEEGRVGANATLLLGVEDGAFSYDGVFSIFYEHRLFPKLFWRIGYARYPILGNSIMVGIGGSF